MGQAKARGSREQRIEEGIANTPVEGMCEEEWHMLTLDQKKAAKMMKAVEKMWYDFMENYELVYDDFDEIAKSHWIFDGVNAKNG